MKIYLAVAMLVVACSGATETYPAHRAFTPEHQHLTLRRLNCFFTTPNISRGLQLLQLVTDRDLQQLANLADAKGASHLRRRLAHHNVPVSELRQPEAAWQCYLGISGEESPAGIAPISP